MSTGSEKGAKSACRLRVPLLPELHTRKTQLQIARRAQFIDGLSVNCFCLGKTLVPCQCLAQVLTDFGVPGLQPTGTLERRYGTRVLAGGPELKRLLMQRGSIRSRNRCRETEKERKTQS